jgi:hypothetical protein
MLLILSAKSPVLETQVSANISYVLRPISKEPEANYSSSLNFCKSALQN